MIVSSDKKRRPDRKKLAKRGLNAKCALNALKNESVNLSLEKVFNLAYA